MSVALDTSFRNDLIQYGLLLPTGVDGLYGRSEMFEDVIDGLNRFISLSGAYQKAEILRFPPGMSRKIFEESEYLNSFPNLAGTVHSFCGDDHAHRKLLRCVGAGEDWTENQRPSDIVMTPAACYPAYPIIAQRGRIAEAGHTIDLFSYCFRCEPSLDPARMQMFRMREFVKFGTAETVMAFREDWLGRGRSFIEALALPVIIDVANDPFFGRAGKLQSDNQRVQKLKFELLIPITSVESPTACLSFNYHMDHFSQIWPLRTASGEHAHTACVGFGMERITLALFRHHGFDTAMWPSVVRKVIWSD